MVPSAYLRVFQPLDAFEREEQLHWERYLVQRAALGDGPPRFADRPTGDGVGLLAPADREHAEIRVIEGRTYVSPQRLRMRILDLDAGVPRRPADGPLGCVRAEEGGASSPP